MWPCRWQDWTEETVSLEIVEGAHSDFQEAHTLLSGTFFVNQTNGVMGDTSL